MCFAGNGRCSGRAVDVAPDAGFNMTRKQTQLTAKKTTDPELRRSFLPVF